ncbi:MAG: FAD:protein FMN transferase [Thermoguttaceae bacterium]|jgi:thiamine biosynthesis lipoprotein|nr:FAD:protein FMN transferase [Thermoguttaceae bacterium]
MRFVIVLIHAAVLLAGCARPEQEDNRLLAWSGKTMGTQFIVKIVDPPDGDIAVQLRRVVEERLGELEGLLSAYDLGSDVSCLNDNQSVQWMNLSEEIAEVVAEASLVGLLTDGAFDVTCAPLVSLWGFGPGQGAPDRVPTEEQIAVAKTSVGVDKIEYQLDPPTVRKTMPEVQINLSGVAKGYAVDQIAVMLRSAGIANFLVDIGGDVRAQGTNPEGEPWRIGIEAPLPGVRSIQRVVNLADTALATSGDYRNYFVQGGRRRSHIIDPRTGRPIEHRLASVSVLDPSCARADALATGLMVLGPEDGYRLAVEQNLAVLFIVGTDAGFEERMTPEFEAACLPRD